VLNKRPDAKPDHGRSIAADAVRDSIEPAD
jgi:hypothetical protein